MRDKAFRSAIDAKNNGVLTAYNKVTPELVQLYEEDFYRQIFDGNGNIIDEATRFARKEVTLTQELTGFAAGFASATEIPVSGIYRWFATHGQTSTELWHFYKQISNNYFLITFVPLLINPHHHYKVNIMVY